MACKISRHLTIAFGMLGVSTWSVHAQTTPALSVYSSTAEKDCRTVSRGGENGGGERVCPGPAGFVVRISEGDLRETVSVGRNIKAAAAEPAAQAWFGPFNSTTTTIEWRSADKSQPPYAIIQRWHLADIEDEGKDNRPNNKQMLVVTRLPPGAVCHVAFVDVKANPKANELAREAADTLARNFKCGTDKVQVIGNNGRAIELALPR